MYSRLSRLISFSSMSNLLPLFSHFTLDSSCLQGPNRVLSVSAVLAGLPSLHWLTARETSVAAGATYPCPWSAASSDHGPVGAVLRPMHGEKLLRKQHHQGEVLETPSSVPWTQHRYGKAPNTAGVRSLFVTPSESFFFFHWTLKRWPISELDESFFSQRRG